MPYITDGEIIVNFSVVSEEKVDRSADVTEYNVESGENITDHIVIESFKYIINGIIVGDNAAIEFEKLERLFINRNLCYYLGRNIAQDIVIEKFGSSHPSDIINGFSFDLQVRTVNLTTPAEFIISEDLALSLGQIAAQVKKEVNTGRKQTQTKTVDSKTSEEARVLAELKALTF